MPLVALLCVGLLGLADDAAAPAADVAAQYQQARAAAGRTPEAQVRLALWCEARGLSAERARHLALAVLADPAHAAARGLLGLVARDGRWVAPDAVARTVQRDEAARALLAEYDARRSRAPYTADAQWDLGLWADERGLKDQARAHLTAVTRLDPGHDVAWRRLGFKKHDGRWATDEQVAAAKAEADAQQRADKTWRPLLEKWKGMLARPSVREQARTALLGVTDPRAVPSIVRVFGTKRPEDQEAAVGLLGQIESPQAAQGLAVLAVVATTAETRRVAVEVLRRRDPRDFVGLLITQLRTPIRYDLQRVTGPGVQGSLLIHGPKSNTKRLYSTASLPGPLPNLIDQAVSYDKNGLLVVTGATWTQSVFSQSIRGSDAVAIISGGAIPAPPSLAEQYEQFLWSQRLNPSMDAAGRARLQNQVAALSPDQGAAMGKLLDKIPLGSPINLEAMGRYQAGGDFGFGQAYSYSQWTPQRQNPYAGLTAVRDDGSREPFDPDRVYEPVYGNEVRIPIGQMMVDAATSVQLAQRRLDADVAVLEKANRAIRAANDPSKTALKEVTAQDFGDDSGAWSRWWADQQGYALAGTTSEVPTIVEQVSTGYKPVDVPTSYTGLIGVNHSCFAAGTMVRTVDGEKAIERVERGDLVLVQDTASGALSYQPVLTAFHNPPSPTYRIKLGDDEVVATGIHRFWRAGRGWAMARDLKAGDALRVLGGVATVGAVEPEKVRPVFNLEVAAGRSFFVGRLGALVHDNSLVEATPTPFDAPAAATVAR